MSNGTSPIVSLIVLNGLQPQDSLPLHLHAPYAERSDNSSVDNNGSVALNSRFWHLMSTAVHLAIDHPLGCGCTSIILCGSDAVLYVGLLCMMIGLRPNHCNLARGISAAMPALCKFSGGLGLNGCHCRVSFPEFPLN